MGKIRNEPTRPIGGEGPLHGTNKEVSKKVKDVSQKATGPALKAIHQATNTEVKTPTSDREWVQKKE